MTEKQTMAFALLKKMGKKNKILQHILEALCHVIQCEMDCKGNPVKETYNIHIKIVIQAQQKIGFDMIMRDFLAQEWMEALIRQGVPSPEQKLNAFQNIIWTEIIDPLWH